MEILSSNLIIFKILGGILVVMILGRMALGMQRQEHMGAVESKNMDNSARSAFFLEFGLWTIASTLIFGIGTYILVQVGLAIFNGGNIDFLLFSAGTVFLLLGTAMLITGVRAAILFFKHFRREKDNGLQFHFEDKYLIYSDRGRQITIPREAVADLQFVLPTNTNTPLRNLGYTRICLKNGRVVNISFLLNKYFWKFEECFSPIKGTRQYSGKLMPLRSRN